MNWTGTTRNNIKIKIIILDFMLLLFLLTAFSMLTLSVILQNEHNSEAALAQETVITAVRNMENSHGYSFVVNEETNDYELKFAGHMVNPDKVIGMFGQYDLEIYRISDDIFIKNPINQEWEMVNNLEMEDLNNFIQSPTGIMKQILNKCPEPELINKEVMNDTDCLVYLYTPESDERNDFLNTFYPHVSPEWLKNLSLRFWIREENPYLFKIEFLLSLDIPEYGSQEVCREILVKSSDQEIIAPSLLKRETVKFPAASF